MQKKSIALWTSLFVLLLAGGKPVRAEDGPIPTPEDTRPNILLVVCDDMDPEHFGFRSPISVTPTLDRIAQNGTVFETAWMAPKCAPSLASLLTGQHPHEHGRFYNRHVDGEEMPLDLSNTFVSHLDRRGYSSIACGKWWFDDPAAAGFDDWFLSLPEFVREGQSHLHEWLDALPENDPFFIWWAPLLPHEPHNPKQRHLDRIDRNSIVVPDYIQESDREEFLDKEHTLLAMTNWLDEGLDELMVHLEELGRTENLLTIVCIDNGWSNGRVSKGSPYEKGMQSPIILNFPGQVPEGATQDHLVSIVDLYPTILDYAGVSRIPSPSNGRSLRPIIEGTDPIWRTHIIEVAYPGVAHSQNWHREAYATAIRSRRWKSIGYTKNIRPEENQTLRIRHVLTDFPIRSKFDQELYQLALDPLEEENLVFRPEYSDEREFFGRILRQWWVANRP